MCRQNSGLTSKGDIIANIYSSCSASQKILLKKPTGRSAIVSNFSTMNKKTNPNHREYLQTLSKMGAEQRLMKAFELSSITKALFLSGLHERFPDKSETEIKELYLQRIAKCYNRNY